MKTTILILALGIAISSCGKSDNPAAPVVDNGPIGGTYTFTGSTLITDDTVATIGVLNIYENIIATTNLKGSLTITLNNITCKGLMYDYTGNNTSKYVNTTTGATTTTNTPSSGSAGGSTVTYASNYTITTATGELTVTDGQYLFNPSFIFQPANNKYTYTLSGNTLKITTAYYNAANRSRSVSVATFVK